MTTSPFGVISRAVGYLHLHRNRTYIKLSIHPLFYDGPPKWYRQSKVDGDIFLKQITDERLIKILNKKVDKLDSNVLDSLKGRPLTQDEASMIASETLDAIIQ